MSELSNISKPRYLQLEDEKKAAKEREQAAAEKIKEQNVRVREANKSFVEKIFEELKILMPEEIKCTIEAEPSLNGKLHAQADKFWVTVVSHINGHNVTVKWIDPQPGQEPVPVLDVFAGKINQLKIGTLYPSSLPGSQPVLRMDGTVYRDAEAIKNAMISYLSTGKF